MSGPGPAVLPDLLRRRAADDPDAVALVVHGGETLTYERWDRCSSAVARGLAARGVEPGARVALLFDNACWTDYAVSYLAVLKAAGVAVPLAPRFAGPELAQILAHCDPSAVLCPPHLAREVPEGPWWLAAPSEVEQGQGADPFQLVSAPHDLAEVLYTSGTTGTPKGVACSHANLLFHELPPEARAGGGGKAHLSFLHAFPVGTNAGQEVLRLPLRRSGRTAVVLPVFDPVALCQAVAEHRVTRLQLVPAMAQVLLSSAAHHRHEVSSVERITLSSAPAPPALLFRLAESFPRASLYNAYALTESGTARTLMAEAETRPGSVGVPVGGTEVRIVDDAGRDVAAGQTGEVWLRRLGAPARWYYLDPEATEAAFVGDWLRTGDLGHRDAEGNLYLDDRKKDLIVAGGVNISCIEVENALYEHPEVLEAAVFGVAHDVLGQDIAAALVLHAPVTPRALQAFVRQRLAEHKVPHQIFIVDALPRNASGKVLKRELAGLVGLAEEHEREPGATGPRSPTERLVASVWGEVLSQEVLGVDDDFFALGGHSLAAAQIAARLSDALGVAVPLTAVFEAPTVAELAAHLDQLDPNPSPASISASPSPTPSAALRRDRQGPS